MESGLINILWVTLFLRDDEDALEINSSLVPLKFEAYTRNYFKTKWTILDYFDESSNEFNIPNNNYDLICISIYSSDKVFLNFLKKIENFNCLKIIGGHFYPSLFETFRKNSLDGGLMGHGEKPFLELLQNLFISKQKAINYINNTPYWFTKNKPNTEYFRMKKEDLNITNFLDYSLIKNKKLFPYQLSYGCNYKCTFCIDSFNYTKQLNLPLDFVKKEFIYQKSLGINKYVFYDRAFFINKEYNKELLTFMISEKIRGMALYYNFINLDEEIISLYKKIVVFPFLFFFIDADCDTSLKYANKPGNIAYLKRIINFSKLQGFRIFIISLIGYPQQTKEELYQVENNLLSLNADNYSVDKVFIDKDSPLFNLKPNWDDDFLSRRLQEIKKTLGNRNISEKKLDDYGR
jgi:radical SAM superfamily enzyme YgiQ (UPF0313 family)